MNQSTRIIVLGAQTALGAEVARLAVAVSYEVVTTAAEPPVDEPWTHGVDWRGGGLEELGGADAIIAIGSTLDPDVVSDYAERASIPRVVFIDEGDLASVSAESSDELQVVLLRPGVISSEVQLSEHGGLPVSQVAMAALRCSVEEDRRGVYGPEEVAHIGDAMMIQ